MTFINIFSRKYYLLASTVWQNYFQISVILVPEGIKSSKSRSFWGHWSFWGCRDQSGLAIFLFLTNLLLHSDSAEICSTLTWMAKRWKSLWDICIYYLNFLVTSKLQGRLLHILRLFHSLAPNRSMNFKQARVMKLGIRFSWKNIVKITSDKCSNVQQLVVWIFDFCSHVTYISRSECAIWSVNFFAVSWPFKFFFTCYESDTKWEKLVNFYCFINSTSCYLRKSLNRLLFKISKTKKSTKFSAFNEVKYNLTFKWRAKFCFLARNCNKSRVFFFVCNSAQTLPQTL